MTQPSTDLVATARQLATAPGASIGSLLTGLAKVESASQTVDLPKAKLPALDASTREALQNLPALIEGAQLPTEPRELTVDEERSLVALGEAVSEIKLFVEKAKDNGVREALFTHLDRVAERKGSVTPETPRDTKGHYLVDGEGNGYGRSYVRGQSGVSVDELERLVQEGAITQRQFLSVTRQVRVIDEAALLSFIGKNPGKIGLIRRALKATKAASCSLKFR